MTLSIQSIRHNSQSTTSICQIHRQLSICCHSHCFHSFSLFSVLFDRSLFWHFIQWIIEGKKETVTGVNQLLAIKLCLCIFAFFLKFYSCLYFEKIKKKSTIYCVNFQNQILLLIKFANKTITFDELRKCVLCAHLQNVNTNHVSVKFIFVFIFIQMHHVWRDQRKKLWKRFV